ncbi:MAG: ThuA domain-containing protein [Fimbriimonadaceae bacterium]|nr:ThuA domain-containing protein [Fimbriimonadaceae bacterium]
MPSALIVQGGWTGHHPAEVAEILGAGLRERGFEVDIVDTLDAYLDPQLPQRDLIVPIWTMGEISGEQFKGLNAAVQAGVGLGGVHGGMCDAFRQNTEYQWMTGGQWVAHPGNAGVTYTVHVTQPDHPICAGVEDFEVTSEQYYLHVDPGNDVLANTVFRQWHDVVMPVTWTKSWGRGRVFYCSVGHVPADVQLPMANKMILQGLVWAAAGKSAA